MFWLWHYFFLLLFLCRLPRPGSSPDGGWPLNSSSIVVRILLGKFPPEYRNSRELWCVPTCRLEEASCFVYNPYGSSKSPTLSSGILLIPGESEHQNAIAISHHQPLIQNNRKSLQISTTERKFGWFSTLFPHHVVDILNIFPLP